MWLVDAIRVRPTTHVWSIELRVQASSPIWFTSGSNVTPKVD